MLAELLSCPLKEKLLSACAKQAASLSAPFWKPRRVRRGAQSFLAPPSWRAQTKRALSFGPRELLLISASVNWRCRSATKEPAVSVPLQGLCASTGCCLCSFCQLLQRTRKSPLFTSISSGQSCSLGYVYFFLPPHQSQLVWLRGEWVSGCRYSMSSHRTA